MKKTNVTYAAILMAIGIIIGFGAAFILIRAIHAGFWVTGVIFSGVALAILFTIVKGIVWKTNTKKLEHTFSEKGFTPDAIFESTVGKIYIDSRNGSIGVISKLNPFQLQIVPASQIQSTGVDDGEVLGGTRQVSFCFRVDGTTWKVPTLTANSALSMRHAKVVAALEVASDYCKMINQAKNV